MLCEENSITLKNESYFSRLLFFNNFYSVPPLHENQKTVNDNELLIGNNLHGNELLDNNETRNE